MKIKKTSLDNLKELQEIGIRSYLPHYQHLWQPGGIEWYMQHCFGDAVLQKELTDENIEYYIAADDGNQNIGILKLVLHKPLPDSDVENALYLEKIYFIKEWTGKGVGRELLNFAISRAEELGRDCIWLKAMDTSVKPIAAYQRAGFTIHSRTLIDAEFELIKEEMRGMVVMKKCFEK
jgi:diamine N-acetyltransferase